MRRRLCNLATVLSLLLCVAVAALWVRSYRWMDQLRWWLAPGAVVAVQSDHGRVYLATAWRFDHSRRGWEREARDVAGRPGVWERDAEAANYRIGLLGFGYVNADGVEGMAERLRLVTVPHGFLCLALAAPPAGRLAGALRRRRYGRVGRCVRCGYDLRATPGRCPECGTEAVAGPAATTS